MTQLCEEEEISRLEHQCTLFLLHKQRGNVPIKRTDIVKSVLRDVQAQRKTVNEVIKRTKQRLKRVHGFDLVETNETTKSFMLVNKVPWSEQVPLQWDGEERKQQILLLPVLSMIFMSGGCITEGKLMAFLRKLQIISVDSNNSPFFGDIEQILKKDFVNQRYLVYEEVPNVRDNDDPVYQVSWGLRAVKEIDKGKILQHVSQMCGCQMSDFAEQFAEVSL